MRGTNEVFTDYEKYLKRYVVDVIVVEMEQIANLAQIRLAQPGTSKSSMQSPSPSNNLTEEVHRCRQRQVWAHILGRAGV